MIDWELIETHFKDLMRVTVSVREGTISSTLLLKRLRSGSHKNATYTAFRRSGGDSYRPVAPVPLGRAVARPGDGRDQQGRGV